MQVDTRARHDAATARMGDLSAQLDRLQASISTGKRITTTDDDPVGAARLLRIERTLAATATQRSGIDRAASRLGSADAALDGVSTLLLRAKEIALQGATATLNANDRATLAAEVGQLSEQLLGYANARDGEGGSVFAGARTGQPAYAADSTGAVAWQGVGSAPVLALDRATISTGIDGPAVFDGEKSNFAMLDKLAASLREADGPARSMGMTTALGDLDIAISRTADTRATLGTRMARLDTEAAEIDAATVRLESEGTATGSLDMPAAIARMQRLSVVLQAAQLSFTRVSGLSLWDMLR